MAARLFLDERNLAQLGFTQPNILTLRALTEFLNVRNTVTTVVQPIGDLTTTGLLSRVGDNLWATRTIVGTTDHIDVADGDGVAANPTLSLPDSGVTAGDYGDASNYVILTVDAQGRITDAQEVALPTGSGLLDTIGSTRGSILFRGASGWQALTPGTSGQFLKTLGAGADPAWGTVSSGGSAWSSAGSWTWSTNVTEVDFTGLGSYNELIIIARGISASASGTRVLRVSVDNGTSFFSTSSDYAFATAAGIEGGTTGFSHDTASTAARDLFVHIINTKGSVKHGIQNASTKDMLFVGSTSDINAVRVTNTAGGNLTAGSIRLFGR